MASRLEVNFTRLLKKCEAMTSEKETGNWRLEKYVAALQDQLVELRQVASMQNQEVLTEYSKKVDFLKGLLEAEKLPSASEKAMAANLLSTRLTVVNPQTTQPTKELHLKTKARYQNDMRAELLGTDSENNSILRQRHGHRSTESESQQEDIETVLNYHKNMQEKIAEEMVHLAANMKENALTSSKIIQEDNKRLEQSTKLADSNYGKLKVESERLEGHVARSCNLWMWIMLVVVAVTFLSMIVFMRLFRKS